MARACRLPMLCVVALCLLAGTPRRVLGLKPFQRFTDCQACVAAGFGWSLAGEHRRAPASITCPPRFPAARPLPADQLPPPLRTARKCGGFSNKICSDAEEPKAPTEACDEDEAAPKQSALAYIESRQNPSDCASTKYFHLDTESILGKPYDSRGFAAVVREINICFMVATAQDRVFVLNGEIGNYGDSEKLLKPLSKCKLSDMRNAPSELVYTNVKDPRDRISDCARALEAHAGWTGENHDRRKATYWEKLGANIVPPQFAKIGYNWQSWMGAHERWLLRPGKKIASNVRQIRKSLGYPEGGDGVVGVHIRHGDRARDLKNAGVAAGQAPIEFFGNVRLGPRLCHQLTSVFQCVTLVALLVLTRCPLPRSSL